MFSYACFGLCLHSDLPFPNAVRSESDHADIVIRAGDVPTTLAGATHQGVLYQLNETALIYYLPGLARFWVKDGREIVYAAPPTTDIDTLRAFLMVIILPLLFHQRHEMPIRGCAVEIDGGAVILTGYSGVGKSTLAAALHQRGFRVLADEFTVVRFDEAAQQPLVYPSFPVLHLWRFALHKLNYSQTAIEQLPTVRPGLQKHILSMGDTFRLEPLPVRGIYIMNAPMRDTDVLVPLTLEKSLLNVNWILSYQRLAIEMNSIKHYWQLAGHLVAQARFWYLNRLKQTFNTDELIRAVTQSVSR